MNKLTPQKDYKLTSTWIKENKTLSDRLERLGQTPILKARRVGRVSYGLVF